MSSNILKKSDDLRSKTLKSISAVGVIQLFKKLVTFAVSVALYRFLSSRDYGIYALCESVLMIAVIFADFGVEDSYVLFVGSNPAGPYPRPMAARPDLP